MIKIKSISIGLPAQEATHIAIRPIINSTTDLDCNTYYSLFSSTKDEEGIYIIGTMLAEGNYFIDEEEYKEWGLQNSFIENIVLLALGLERE